MAKTRKNTTTGGGYREPPFDNPESSETVPLADS